MLFYGEEMINPFSVILFIIAIAIAIHNLKRPFKIIRSHLALWLSIRKFKKFRKSL